MYKHSRTCNYENINNFGATCFWCLINWLLEKLRVEGMQWCPYASIPGNTLHLPLSVNSSPGSCKKNGKSTWSSAILPSLCFININCHSLLGRRWKIEEVQNLPKWTQKFCGLLLLKLHFSTGRRRANGMSFLFFLTVHTVFSKRTLVIT